MDFDNLVTAVVASQTATLQTQIAILTKLQENTGVSYATAISQIQATISALANVRG